MTLDQPLPSVAYNSYRLYALSQGGNVCWRRFKVMNSAVAAAMQQYFPYPFAFSFANGAAAAMTSAPVCNVFWSSSGSPPYNMASVGVVIDPVAGTITTVSPTSLVFGGGVVTPPTDVQVFLPVANGSLEVFSPAATYFTGTSALIEGIQRIKVVTVRDWTDYSLNSNMQVFANELLQSMCDVVLEGSTSYLGMATAFLIPAQAVQITGSTYTTGWEGGGVSNPQIVSGGSGLHISAYVRDHGIGHGRGSVGDHHGRRAHFGLGLDARVGLHRRGDGRDLRRRRLGRDRSRSRARVCRSHRPRSGFSPVPGERPTSRR